MTLLDAMAQEVESAAQFLGHFLMTTKPEYLDWKPKAEGFDSKTRSAMEQVAECVGVNNRAAAALRGDSFEWVDHAFASVFDAQQALVASAKALADEVRKSDESVLGEGLTMPWGEVTRGFLIRLAVANMDYHNGQINFIQCLYGDDVFHMPGAE